MKATHLMYSIGKWSASFDKRTQRLMAVIHSLDDGCFSLSPASVRIVYIDNKYQTGFMIHFTATVSYSEFDVRFQIHH